MSKVYKNLTETIGNTPLVELTNFEKKHGLEAKIFAKLEYFNPLGSAKDRVALSMIEQGIKEGKINKYTVLIEPTSGNTGIGLAFVAATKGLKLVLTMPETMSIERQRIVKALGAEVVLTKGKLGMQGAIDKANEIAAENSNSFIPQQFENFANPAAHKAATGVEIWEDTDGLVDIFVASVGTGGTITGTGEVLKSKNKDIKIVAVEPATSAVMSGEKAGPHKIQGIGAGFIPKIMNMDLVDEIVKSSNEAAYEMSREIAKTDGILVGISAGATLYAATELAKRPENKGKTIVALFTDSGERYMSTDLFE